MSILEFEVLHSEQNRRSPAEPLLRVRDLHVAYDRAEVVRACNLDIYPGEFVCLLGRNGAGKSTLLNAICGLIPKKHGSVWLDGEDVTDATTKEIVRLGMVQVLEGHRIFPSLSVEDNIRLAQFGKGGKVKREALDRIYELFPEIADKKTQLASRLSGGQQEIVAVAQGIVAEPRLLILDEPSGGLAPIVVDRILSVASQLTQSGVAVLLVEQLVDKALSICDRCYLMDTGRIVLEGPAQQMVGTDALRRAFLGDH